MRRSILTLAILTSFAAAAVAYTEEPLPPALKKSQGSAWRLLEGVTVAEREVNGTWIVEKTYSPELLARDGTELSLTGYAIPLSAGELLTSLILVRDATDCPFCGTGGTGPVLEVELDLGIRQLPEFSIMTVTGRLALVRDTDTTQAYRLVAAVPTTDH